MFSYIIVIFIFQAWKIHAFQVFHDPYEPCSLQQSSYGSYIWHYKHSLQQVWILLLMIECCFPIQFWKTVCCLMFVSNPQFKIDPLIDRTETRPMFQHPLKPLIDHPEARPMDHHPLNALIDHPDTSPMDHHPLNPLTDCPEARPMDQHPLNPLIDHPDTRPMDQHPLNPLIDHPDTRPMD